MEKDFYSLDLDTLTVEKALNQLKKLKEDLTIFISNNDLDEEGWIPVEVSYSDGIVYLECEGSEFEGKALSSFKLIKELEELKCNNCEFSIHNMDEDSYWNPVDISEKEGHAGLTCTD